MEGRWMNSAGKLRVLAAKTSWVLICWERVANVRRALASTCRNSCLLSITDNKKTKKKQSSTHEQTGGTKEKYQHTSNLMLNYGLLLFLSTQLIWQPRHPIKLDIFAVISIIPSLRLRLHLHCHFLICNPHPEIVDRSLLREYIRSNRVSGTLWLQKQSSRGRFDDFFLHIHFFNITTVTFVKFIIKNVIVPSQ